MWLIDAFTASAVSGGTSATCSAISLRACSSSARGTTRLTSPYRSASAAPNSCAQNRNSFALRGPSSHGSTSSSTPTPDMRSTGFENRASSAATIRSHMHASMRPGRGTRSLHRGDRRLAEVADLHELVEVHDLFVAELALGGRPHRRPVFLAREQLFEVVTGGEMLALRGEDDHPDRVVGVGPVEGGVELVDHPAVLRVGRLRAGSA